ncbi:MAG: retention module-containing protein [Porticoccaceae bacterium]
MNDLIEQKNTTETGESQQIVGIVTSTAGATAVVVSADGSLRELNPGDPVHENDVLQVIEGSHVVITFADGSVRELPREGGFQLNGNSYQQLAQSDYSDDSNPEFEQLLAALEEGKDPTDELEEPAAGDVGGASDEIGQGLVIELSGQEAIAKQRVLIRICLLNPYWNQQRIPVCKQVIQVTRVMVAKMVVMASPPR